MLRKVQAGLDRAAEAARERGRQFETPVWVWENGEWVDASADTGTSYQRQKAEPARLREEPEESSES